MGVLGPGGPTIILTGPTTPAGVTLGLAFCEPPFGSELELLELIQSKMTQKPVLRGEVGARA